jgi:hypothetical protein
VNKLSRELKKLSSHINESLESNQAKWIISGIVFTLIFILIIGLINKFLLEEKIEWK